MATLGQNPDWDSFVERAVDQLLRELAENAGAGRDEEFAVRPQVDIESSTVVRQRLRSYSMSLLTAAGAGTGDLVCDNGTSTVECTLVLRPHGTAYYRCLHSPPDCYDASHQSIACP